MPYTSILKAFFRALFISIWRSRSLLSPVYAEIKYEFAILGAHHDSRREALHLRTYGSP